MNKRFYNSIYIAKVGIGSNVISDSFDYKDSTNTVVNCYIEDDGYGVLGIFSNSTGIKKTIAAKIGTIDYDSGTIKLIAFNPVKINATTLNFNASPYPASDVLTVKGNLLKIDLTDSKALQVKALAFNQHNRGQVNIFNRKV